MTSKQRVRVGVAGCGRMGQLHLRNLTELAGVFELAGICDSHEPAREQARARFGVRPYADFDEMLEKERPRAVVIATPSATHPDLIRRAAAQGIHIFCEKPPALTSEEARAAAWAVSEAGVLFQLGFQRRFDAGYREAQSIIRSGALGEPLTFKAVARDDWKPDLRFARAEVSGGLLLDMAVHDFDLARWMMASEVARVFVEGSALLYPDLKTVGDIDNAVVNLRFRSGAIGNVEASRTGTYGYDIRTEVVGTRGALHVGRVGETTLVSATREGMRRRTLAGFESRFHDAYRTEIEEFGRCILEERAPECGMTEGLLALEVVRAATESLRTGMPVEVHPVRGPR